MPKSRANSDRLSAPEMVEIIEYSSGASEVVFELQRLAPLPIQTLPRCALMRRRCRHTERNEVASAIRVLKEVCANTNS
jgi:hypothetical protein